MLTYGGEAREFVERFPVSRKSKHDSFSVPIAALASAGEYKVEAAAWYVPAKEEGEYTALMPTRGTVGRDWWGDAHGRRGHVRPPAFGVCRRSFHMTWSGNGALPRVLTQTGF